MVKANAMLQVKELTFEDVWKQIEEVRSDPECMEVLNKLIKSHPS